MSARALFLALVLASPLPAAAADVELLRATADKQYAELEKLYTDIHANPELSLQEANTAKRLAAELRAAGYEVTEKIGGHGVVAVLKNGPGKTLLIRGDMDALPVKEETGAAYASKVVVTDPAGKSVPVMHACGHDIHVTCLVGVARAMVAHKDRWSGTLVLMGQPAEELVRGAKAMLDDGLFTRFPRPDFCLALHVDAEIPAGKVGVISGFAMANSDSADIVIRGVGGHGAMPHTTRDPIVIAAQTVLNLQIVRSREIRPIDPVVITVGSIHGGTKNNIIPDDVTLQITVRTYTDEVRAKTFKAIDRIVKGTAATAGVPTELEPKITWREGTPALYNTPELTERVVGVLKGVVGEEGVVKKDPSMGAEDFGLLGRQEPKIPICMFRLGSVAQAKIDAARNGGPALPSLHSSKYLPEREPTIKTGVTTMTAAAIDLLRKN